MISVKVKTEGIRFSIPVPYLFINLGILLLSSEFLHKQMNKWIKESMKEKEMTFTIPQLDKKELGKIVKELKSHRGLEIVDVQAKDGTEVFIRL
ncbi:hypothetical protein [Psychrobacillus lasiicapitis]|uniref:Uncharacterized protein n=1 Tax=Psychrobacillus lasiicapitis TaxID=1636719 RepID=A0A544SVK2_9BACI|nr:hypothetical protein [Psychrobacillus lasiicapitis]TQR09188.1 hypothetical protein FG382_20550 [Psychrobacillus lasiicapitis]GGA48236.1 hypothetical protein GCM10011384_42430 [Psychrobacillus lasiicapitis]